MKTVRKLLSVWFSCFILANIAMIFFLSQFKLTLGERIGSGWFYLKGFYVRSELVNGQLMNVTVHERGPGVITLPLAAACVMTCLYLLISTLFSRQKGTTQ